MGSSYGAASSLMIILLWIFFSSCILFLGAEFTQVYANMYGSKIKPASNALDVPRGMTPAAARAELLRCAGSQFDPIVVEAFIGTLGESNAAGSQSLVNAA